jgi:UDP-N-acetylmuramate--alanine ligase
MLKARALGLPVVHRAAELARLTEGRRLIAVTGTCGKSSVTAMLGCLLEGAGFDPFVVNGAAVVGWDAGGTRIGSVRKGGEWAVIEADESDRSLMVFRPEHAVITNASADHFGLGETLSLFAGFRARVPGVVIDGLNEAGGPEKVRLEGWNGFFTVDGAEYQVPLPGLHNVHNAWHAVRMALALGAAPERLAAALRAFGGVERRLQRVGFCGPALVVDDYAHNPEKLAAAWTTLADAFPAGVCAVWRPHGYAPLRKMIDGLVAVFCARVPPRRHAAAAAGLRRGRDGGPERRQRHFGFTGARKRCYSGRGSDLGGGRVADAGKSCPGRGAGDVRRPRSGTAEAGAAAG